MSSKSDVKNGEQKSCNGGKEKMIKIELEVRHTHGLPDIFCPVFICDYCEQKIVNAYDGMYHYKIDKDGIPTSESVKIYHKKDCSYHAENKERTQGMTGFPWDELTNLVGCLINNTGLQWKRLVSEYCPNEEIKTVQQVVKQRIAEGKGTSHAF